MAPRNKQKVVLEQAQLTEFLRTYREHECLWNPKLPEYTQKDSRQEALQSMGTKFSLTVEDVKRKIHGLRSTYIFFRNKKIKSLENNETDGKYEPTLIWYHEMDFLNDVVTGRRPYDRYKPPTKRSNALSNASTRTVTTSNITVGNTGDDDSDNLIKIKKNCLDLDSTEEQSTNGGDEHDTIIDQETTIEQEPEEYTQTEHPVFQIVTVQNSANHDTSSHHHHHQQQQIHSYSQHHMSHPQQQQTSMLTTATIASRNDNQSSPDSCGKLLSTFRDNSNSGIIVKSSYQDDKDEFACFGHSIAAQLRNLPLTESLQLMVDVQQLITTKRLESIYKSNKN